MQNFINLIILIFSAIVHEVAHGLAAEKLGDDTARRAGRITLNPIAHIDPFGTIILPLSLLLLGSPVVLGAAKPVPVNFNYLKNPRTGMALVSVAGPLSNVFLAVLCVLPLHFGLVNAISGPILIQAILINLALAIFNILPIPPLDGSKIVAAFAPRRWMYTIFEWEQYGFILIFLLLMFGVLDKVFVPLMTAFLRLFGLV